MNGDFAQGTIAAHLPQEVIDKVLANTEEDMEKWLESGNTFDLSDGADRTIAYISFPKDTKPEDVVRVVRCKDCKYCYSEGFVNVRNVCEKHYDFGNVDGNWFCADGERRSE